MRSPWIVVLLLQLALLGATAATTDTVTTITAELIQSVASTSDRLARKPDVVLAPLANLDNVVKSPAPTVTLTLDPSQTHQRIEGFGGAFTEAAAVTLQALPSDLAKQVIDAYFGPTGIHYSLCRLHMGSCDYCMGSYSEDPVPGDFALAHFNVDHDETTLIPLIQQAQASIASGGAPMQLFSSPWSPPAWMKRNNRMDNSDLPVGMKAGSKYWNTWANYFSKFITAYASHGINISMVTVQNEPTNAPCAWESCAYDPAAEADFVGTYLGPQLAKDHPGVKILMLDDNKDLLPVWTDTAYNSNASQYLYGAGVHWYTGDYFENVAKTRAKWPDKVVIATEACTGPGTVLGQWIRGERYGHDMIGDLTHGAAGWVDWNMALGTRNCTKASSLEKPCVTGPNHVDPVGDDSPVIADVVLHTVHFQPMFWYMGQFSKFVPPGSHRIDFTDDSSLAGGWSGAHPLGYDDDDNVDGLQIVAFVTPADAPKAYGFGGVSKVVAVVMNGQSKGEEARLVYQGYYADVVVPAHSIQTYVLPVLSP